MTGRPSETAEKPKRPDAYYAFPPHGMLQGFLDTVRRHPNRTAVEWETESITYAELMARASRIARAIVNADDHGAQQPVAIYAVRSIDTFAAVIATLLTGRGFVPLSPQHPALKTRKMISLSGVEIIITAPDQAGKLASILAGSKTVFAVIFIGHEPDAGALANLRSHRLSTLANQLDDSAFSAAVVQEQTNAYIMFTSGSTGTPKGVPIAHGNIVHFLEAVNERFDFHNSDRFSQLFELVFDLSIFDLFVAWSCGACVCCPSQSQLFSLGRYVKEAGLTVWFSVPAVAHLVRRRRGLSTGVFPKLRYSLFCGEALESDLAESWRRAAPNSTLINLYGPTEATVACTVYECPVGDALSVQDNGLVPIGTPLRGVDVLITDDTGGKLAPGRVGELRITGPQTFGGYLNSPAKTAEVLVQSGTPAVTAYRSGDRGKLDPRSGLLHYMGRQDGQVQVRGVRIEVSEVELALREASGCRQVAVISLPYSQFRSEQLIAFVESQDLDEEAVKNALRNILAEVAVPARIVQLDEFPLSANGKVDRRKMALMVEEKP